MTGLNSRHSSSSELSKRKHELHKREETNSLVAFLKSIKCSSPVFPNDLSKIVTVDSNITVRNLFRKFVQTKVMAFPVVTSDTKTPVSVISLAHLMSYLLNKYTQDEFQSGIKHTVTKWLTKSSTEQMKSKTIANVQKNLSPKLDPVYSITENEDLYTAVKLMIETKTRRVLVMCCSDHKHVSNLITHSRILNMIGTMVDDIPTASKTVQELGLIKPVLVVNENFMAYTAFKLMEEKNVSGVGVVNAEGKLIGCISVSDIKLLGWNMEYWSMLGGSVKDYLQQLAARKDYRIMSKPLIQKISEQTDFPIVLTCQPQNTLASVIKWINMHKIHRMFVIDEDEKPIGVISILDILEVLIPVDKS